MPIVADLISQEYSLASGTARISCAYMVRSSTDAVVTFAQAAQAVTQVGLEYVDPATGATGLYVTSISVTGEAGNASKVWRVTIEASNELADAEFTATESSVAPQVVDAWRSGAAVAANLDAPGDGDIGGTKVDVGGEPISAIQSQQTLSVTNVTSASPDMAIIRGLVGKRNNALWLGAAVGYVVFRGASARRIALERWETSYEFVFDSSAHLRQAVGRDVDGKPILDAAVANVTHATLVMWRQPFPATGDFTTLNLVT